MNANDESPEVDYGPLTGLIGQWYGDSGMDIAPEEDGDDHNPYYETLLFEAAGDVDNAETQELSIVRYHQVVARKRNDKVFHNESGYLLWDADNEALMLTFSIPRGVAIVANGRVETWSSGLVLEFSAAKDTEWGIVESPFMAKHAHTQSFTRQFNLMRDTLSYTQTTIVDIYGRTVDHTDENELHRKH